MADKPSISNGEAKAVNRYTTVGAMFEELDAAGLDVGAAIENTPASDFDMPVEWNPRLRTTAGRARVDMIELNPRLRTEGPEAVRATFLHELAHVLAGLAADHGPAWRRQCRELGLEPQRTHRYASMVAERAPLRVVADCDRCGRELRRRRALARGARWAHKGCGGEFVRR